MWRFADYEACLQLLMTLTVRQTLKPIVQRA